MDPIVDKPLSDENLPNLSSKIDYNANNAIEALKLELPTSGKSPLLARVHDCATIKLLEYY
jgi:hypothetical protein